MSKKVYSILYKAILVSLSFVSIYNMFYNIDGNKFAYFTNLSNVVVFIIMLTVLILNIIDVKNGFFEEKNTHLLQYKGIGMLCITVTFLIYSTMLADYGSKSNYTFQNLTVHYIVPIMTILDYFLFDEKGKIKWWNPLIWILCSVIYLPFIFIRALILGNNTTLIKYPYFFLNVDNLGAGKVILWCIGILLFFTALAYLLFLFDYKKRK